MLRYNLDTKKITMTVTCYVPGCRSGYRSNGEKGDKVRIHFFCPPKSEEILEKWKKAIPRKGLEMQPHRHRICHLHFDEKYLIKNDRFIINGKVEILPRERWRLVDDAVPHIFPSLPKYFTRRIKTRPPPRKCYMIKEKTLERRQQLLGKRTQKVKLIKEHSQIQAARVADDSSGVAAVQHNNRNSVKRQQQNAPVQQLLSREHSRRPIIITLKSREFQVNRDLDFVHKPSSEYKYESNFMASLNSLPTHLVLWESGVCRNRYGVWCREDIPEGTRFGPYQGFLYYNQNVGQDSIAFKNSSELKSNWLSYINHALRKEQENLIPFHFQGEMFYLSCKNIPANTELLVGCRSQQGSLKTTSEDCDKFQLCKIPAICNKPFTYDDYKRNSTQCCLQVRNTNVDQIRQKNDSCSSSSSQEEISVTTYVCDKCGENFGQDIDLKSHRWHHFGMKPYICDKCEKLFMHSYSLVVHIRKTHAGEMPYKCDECDRKFAECSFKISQESISY